MFFNDVKLKRLLLTTLLVFLLSFTYAQMHTLTGVITDSEDNTPLPGATIESWLVGDSAQHYSTITKTDGSFFINTLNKGTLRLRVSFMGYNSKEISIQLQKVKTRKSDVQIKLQKRIFQLAEVDINQTQNRVVVKEDTIEYSASAYKVNADAMVVDLIAKLPGLSVEDNQVTAYGEQVTKVFVDGEEFFTGDPGIALNNLPADIVDKIEVIDKKSDQAEFTGFDDGNRYKAINIKTKNGRLNGQFGKIEAAVGTNDRYLLNGTLNQFSGSKRVTLIAGSNNINKQSFYEHDHMGFQGDNASGGLSTTHNAGINFNLPVKDKIKINGNYFFNAINSTNESNLLRNYLFTDTTLNHYSENNNGKSKNQNHSLNFRIDYKINRNNSVLLSPALSIQDFNRQTSKTGTGYTESNDILTQTESNNDSKSKGYRFSNGLLLRHRFTKDGRTLSSDIKVGISQTDNQSVYNSFTQNMSSASNEEVDQKQKSSSNSGEFTVNLCYTEPLGSKSQLMFTYEEGQTKNESFIDTYDLDSISGNYSSIDTSSTGNSLYKNRSHTASVGIRYNVSKYFHLWGTLHAKSETMNGSQNYAQSYNTSYTCNVIEPNAELNYSKQNHLNLRFSYSGQSQMPGANQLYRITNITDPLNITDGNPDLEHSYTHQFQTMARFINNDNTRFTVVKLSASATQNYITSNTYQVLSDTVIDNDLSLIAGATYSQPVNCNGYYQASGSVTHSFPCQLVKCNLSIDGGVDYLHSPEFVNKVKQYLNQTSTQASFGLTSNISEKVDFNLKYNASYSFIDNQSSESENGNYYHGTLSFNVYVMPVYKLVLTSDCAYSHYVGLNTTNSPNTFLWNAGVAYKLFKHNRGEIKVSVYDLLDSSISISRNATSYYIEDKESTVLKRYALITFSYKLSKFNA